MRDICLELIISASMEIEFVIAKKNGNRRMTMVVLGFTAPNFYTYNWHGV